MRDVLFKFFTLLYIFWQSTAHGECDVRLQLKDPVVAEMESIERVIFKFRKFRHSGGLVEFELLGDKQLPRSVYNTSTGSWVSFTPPSKLIVGEVTNVGFNRRPFGGTFSIQINGTTFVGNFLPQEVKFESIKAHSEDPASERPR